MNIEVLLTNPLATSTKKQPGKLEKQDQATIGAATRVPIPETKDRPHRRPLGGQRPSSPFTPAIMVVEAKVVAAAAEVAAVVAAVVILVTDDREDRIEESEA